MRSLKAAALAAACFMLCACSEGLYSATAASNGQVVIVNRVTGDARGVRGDTVVPLQPPQAAERAQLRNFTPASIPNQPLLIRGSAKYRDGSMLVRIAVTPARATMSDAEWLAWRAHLMALKPTAGLNVQFTDGDSFEVTSQLLELSTTTRQVDFKGDTDALITQISIAVTPENYDAIRDWQVGWNGFWPDYFPPASPPTEAPNETPTKPKAKT